MFGQSNVIKAGVQLSLLDRLTPEMRKTLAGNKNLLDNFAKSANIGNAFGPMAQENLAQYERGMAKIAASQKLLQMGAVGVGASIAAQLYTGNAFVKFEDDMAYIDTILDSKEKAIELYGKDVLKIARYTGAAVADISRGAYQALSSNVPKDFIVDFTRKMAEVSTAGRTSVESATKSTLSIMNAYGLEKNMTNVGDVTDKLFNLVNRGIIEYNELDNVISEFTASGAMANINYQDMLAALATITLSGKSPSEGGTGLNRFVLSIMGASDETKKFAKTLGIDFNVNHLKEIGMMKFLDEVEKGIQGNSEALNKLFPETRAFTTVAPLIGTMRETFLDISNSMNNAAGATDKAYSKMTDTMQHNINRAKQSLESIKISIGGIFADQYGPGLEKLAGQLSDIAENETAMKNIANTIKGLGWTGGIIAGVSAIGKGAGLYDLAASGFKSALSTGKMVTGAGGLAFLGSAAGKLTNFLKVGSSAGAAGAAGGWAGYGAPWSAASATSVASSTMVGSILSVAMPILSTAVVMAVSAYLSKKIDQAANNNEYKIWTKESISELQNIVNAINEFKEGNGENLKLIAAQNGLSVSQMSKYGAKTALPESVLSDIQSLEASIKNKKEDELFNILGGGYGTLSKPYWETDEAKRKRIMENAGILRSAYGQDSLALENMYWNQAMEYFGNDREMASAVMPYIAAGLLPNLQNLFQNQMEKSTKKDREDFLKNFKVKSAIADSSLYNPSKSARYQYNPDFDKQRIQTFEDLFSKKPEKDDWQIVVNINGQNATAVLNKNGSPVKDISSIVNDIKLKNSFKNNPYYIEKPV